MFYAEVIPMSQNAKMGLSTPCISMQKCMKDRISWRLVTSIKMGALNTRRRSITSDHCTTKLESINLSLYMIVWIKKQSSSQLFQVDHEYFSHIWLGFFFIAFSGSEWYLRHCAVIFISTVDTYYAQLNQTFGRNFGNVTVSQFA